MLIIFIFATISIFQNIYKESNNYMTLNFFFSIIENKGKIENWKFKTQQLSSNTVWTSMKHWEDYWENFKA